MARSRMNWSRFEDFIKSDSWREGYSRPTAGVTSNDVNLSNGPVDNKGSLYMVDVSAAWRPFTDVKGATCASGVVAVGAIMKFIML